MGDETRWDRVKAWLGFGWEGAERYVRHGEPYGWRERLWNWTRWRIHVTRAYADGPDESLIPWRLRRSHPIWNRDVVVYMLPPLHWLGKAWYWWRENRWALDRWLRLKGLLCLPEAKAMIVPRWYEWPFEWRWPFVNAHELDEAVKEARSEGFVRGMQRTVSDGHARWNQGFDAGYELGYREGAGAVGNAVREMLEEERNALREESLGCSSD